MKRRTIFPMVLVSVAAVIVVAFMAMFSKPKPFVPEFLDNLTAEGGSWSSCPQGAHRFDYPFPPKGNSVANQRLAALFPTGASEAKLVEFLKGQKFRLIGPCNKDASVRTAIFVEARGFGSITTMQATVIWKVDNAHRIVWVKGTICYLGF